MTSIAWAQFTAAENITGNDDTFWQAVALFHSKLPGLVEAGVMGYFNISNTQITNTSTPLRLQAGLWLLNKTVPDLESLLGPVLDNMSTSFFLDVTHTIQTFPNFYSWWKEQYPPAAVGFDTQLGSRFLDAKALSKPLPSLAASIRKAYSGIILIGNLVVGPGVWNAKPAGGLGSMSPAWRTAVVDEREFVSVRPAYQLD